MVDKMDNIIDNYLKIIKNKEKTGMAQEASYYYPLEMLLTDTAKKILGKEIIVIQEAYHPFGIPDFTILNDKEEIIGIIEAKKPYTKLENLKKSEQVIKYRKKIDNVLLTNFYEFVLYNKNKDQYVSLINNTLTSDNNIEKLLISFLYEQEDEYDDKYIICGRRLTKNQIDELTYNKRINVIRNGSKFSIMKSDLNGLKISESYFKLAKETFVIDKQILSRKQIIHLEHYGWIVISHDDDQYLIRR